MALGGRVGVTGRGWGSVSGWAATAGAGVSGHEWVGECGWVKGLLSVADGGVGLVVWGGEGEGLAVDLNIGRCAGANRYVSG